MEVMYGVGLNSSLFFISSRQDCTGQPGYPRQAPLPRTTGIFRREHSKIGSVDPNEWVQCDGCGWCMPDDPTITLCSHGRERTVQASIYTANGACQANPRPSLAACTSESAAGRKVLVPTTGSTAQGAISGGIWGKMCPTTTS